MSGVSYALCVNFKPASLLVLQLGKTLSKNLVWRRWPAISKQARYSTSITLL